MATANLGAVNAIAQSYPTKPIRMVITFSPGGNVDLDGRAVAGKPSGKISLVQ